MEVYCHLPPLLFFSSQLLLWVLGRKGFPHLSWTRNYMMLPEHGPQASLGGIHPCALCYESSSTGLGWFVHEGTWWLGHGRECGASPNGKSVANPCMLPADWQEQRETSQWVTRPHCWHSSGCILGDSAPGPLIRARCCRWRYSNMYPPVSLFIFLTLILSMASALSVPHLFRLKEDPVLTIVPYYFGILALKRVHSF